MLRYLRALDPDRCGIVRWMGDFKHGPHVCLVFELLEQSLWDFTQQTANNALPLMQLKHVVGQVWLDFYLKNVCVCGGGYQRRVLANERQSRAGHDFALRLLLIDVPLAHTASSASRQRGTTLTKVLTKFCP